MHEHGNTQRDVRDEHENDDLHQLQNCCPRISAKGTGGEGNIESEEDKIARVMSLSLFDDIWADILHANSKLVSKAVDKISDQMKYTQYILMEARNFSA